MIMRNSDGGGVSLVTVGSEVVQLKSEGLTDFFASVMPWNEDAVPETLNSDLLIRLFSRQTPRNAAYDPRQDLHGQRRPNSKHGANCGDCPNHYSIVFFFGIIICSQPRPRCRSSGLWGTNSNRRSQYYRDQGWIRAPSDQVQT